MTNRQAAVQIVRCLQEHGFEALLAGGCVRDMLLGHKPKDYDVATNAKPKEVVQLFPRTLTVGVKFGVVIVLMRHSQVEVATFRSEAGYRDGRHPDEVEFTHAAEDAGRRDFTINGMFYDPLAEQVIDYVGGQADLDRKIVRTIGDPQERFAEDYLRMLRAIRFSTRLGFAIEPATFDAIRDNAARITRISGERIAIELEAILVDPNRQAGTSMLFESGLADAVFPELPDEHRQRALAILGGLRRRVDFALALAGFFAGCQADEALARCHILKLSRRTAKHLTFLLMHRGNLLDDSMSLARLKMLLARPYFWDLYELERATRKAEGDRQSLAALGRLRRRIRTLRGVDVRPKPLLNGHDLIRLGATPGPVLGQLAEELYIAQLEGLLHTTDQAGEWARRWLQEHARTDS
ncbi:MAG: CCA tRNA nucleotidyltransferase [Sedimentisphaerales bacterium]|nr:CCA tRNA nucleotidyltransferase [Sedimentisphaerales bacterium]